MKYFTTVVVLIVYFFSLQVLISCKKNNAGNNQNNPAPAITIQSVKPDSGARGETIIIIGTHFNQSAANDTVKFNGKKAVVQKATNDTLVVIVPLGAGTGAVTVNNVVAPGAVFDYIQTVTVSTFAGSPSQNNSGDYVDGADSNARFGGPTGIAIDAQGNIYVADAPNDLIRKISAGTVSTFAGVFNDPFPTNIPPGYYYFADGAADTARFLNPAGVAVDAQGNVYVADQSNNRVRKISGGIVSTFAGNGNIGLTNGTGDVAEFYGPLQIAIDPQGSLYVSESEDIRKITAAGVVTAFAAGGASGMSGYIDGQDTNARFNNPLGLAVDEQGNIYVADNVNKRIRKITPSGLVSTFAGSGIQGFQDGPADAAQFYQISGVAIDSLSNIYVSDFSCIRKITPGGIVSTLAGTHMRGFADDAAATAQFFYPEGMAFDAQGNLYIAEFGNARIRKITFE